MSALNIKKEMSVNALSMRTYGWMKVNGKEFLLDLKDGINTRPSFFREPTYTNVSEEKSGFPKESVYLPEGVTFTENAPCEVFDKIFGGAIKSVAVSGEKSLSPNGDVLVKHTGQKIPTGLGREMDILMDELDVPFQVFSVEDGVHVKENLEINLHPSEKNTLVRQIIHVGKNARLKVLVDLYSKKNTLGFLGVQTFVLAEEGAHVDISFVQMLGEDFSCLNDFGGVMMKDAHVKSVSVFFALSSSTPLKRIRDLVSFPLCVTACV